MNDLSQVDGFLVDQTFEGTEAWTGFETRNEYTVRSSSTYELTHGAVEDGSSPFVRVLLGGWRPFELEIHSMRGGPDLSMESPFRVLLHEATVRGPDGEPVGTIRRRAGILRRSYELRDAADGSTFELTGTLLRPWTFHVESQGARCGRIAKRWAGLAHELSSDADRFEAAFPSEWSDRRKTLLLCALLLLDMVHFESRLHHLLDALRHLPT